MLVEERHVPDADADADADTWKRYAWPYVPPASRAASTPTPTYHGGPNSDGGAVPLTSAE